MGLLKDGIHNVEVLTASLGENKNKKPRIRLGFRDANGDTATRDLYVTEKALGFTEDILTDCFALTGITDDDFEPRLAGLIGRKCRIRVATVDVGTIWEKFDVVAIWPARDTSEPASASSPDELRRRFAEEVKRSKAARSGGQPLTGAADDLRMVEDL